LETNDNQIEQRLRSYRPAGPPESLRERCLTPSRPARVWPWAAAAAALLITSMAIQAAGRSTIRGADLAFPPGPLARDVEELVDALGGDAAAARLAARIVDEESRAALEAESGIAAGEQP
jgi:hypothetical protein